MGPSMSGGDEHPQSIYDGGWIQGPVPFNGSAATVYVGFINWRSSQHEAEKCKGFPFRRDMMATEMLEAMAILGVESMHVVLNKTDTVESLQQTFIPMKLVDGFGGRG